MKYVNLSVFSAVVACVGLGIATAKAPLQPSAPSTSVNQSAAIKADDSTHSKVAEQYGQLALAFEENKGQTDSQVKFFARGPGYSLFLTPNEAVFNLAKGQGPKSDSHSAQVDSAIQSTVLRAKLVGANTDAAISGEAQLPGVSNYLTGKNQSQWRTDVKQFSRVRYTGVYPGIDLVYYGNQRELEYDFVVAPGADLKNIRLAYTGADKLSLTPKGDLLISTATGELVQHKPVIYQVIDKKRKNVDGRFALGKKHDVSFEVASYDTSYPLTIDPQLGYSTYLGGTDNDYPTTIAVDNAGNAYIGGVTTSTDFPLSANAYNKTALSSYFNVTSFVSKLNCSGNSLVYSTYLSSSSYENVNELAVDASGNVYLAGITGAKNFPLTAGAVKSTLGTYQYAIPYVVKLNPSGSGLVYATFIGGSNDDRILGLAVDANGNAYIAGPVSSTDFPVTAGALAPSAEQIGHGASFIAKLNANGSAYIYSAIFGSRSNGVASGNNLIADIALDSAGNAYVVGTTTQPNFPITSGALQSTYDNSTYHSQLFLSKLNQNGSALIYSTFLAGNAGFLNLGIVNAPLMRPTLAVDKAGNAYIAGTTISDTPTTPGAAQAVRSGNFDAFVIAVNASGGALKYATYLGGSSHDYANGIAVDLNGNVYVTGETFSNNFWVTSGAPQTNFGGGDSDAFITKINPTGSAFVYSSYLGGNALSAYSDGYGSGKVGSDLANAVAVDSCGNAYVTGLTGSINFPITLGALELVPGNNATTLVTGSKGDGFVTKILSGGTALPLIGGALLGVNC